MILDDILAHKRKEVEALKRKRPLPEPARRNAADRRSFMGAVVKEGMSLIAEIKKASPSAGVLSSDFDPERIARTYASAGAHALSVLTDSRFFQGDLGCLQSARKACSLPVLRKDFILDRYQVHEACLAGADAVLLIVRALECGQLAELLGLTRELGMDALVEVHDAEETRLALDSGADIIGVNNRDLATFRTDLARTIELAPLVRGKACLVSESGIRTRDDVERLAGHGVDAILVGETLMRASDAAKAIRALLGKSS